MQASLAAELHGQLYFCESVGVNLYLLVEKVTASLEFKHLLFKRKFVTHFIFNKNDHMHI